MKKHSMIFLLLFVCSFTTQTYSKNHTGTAHNSSLNKTDKMVLEVFSTILVHFAGILQAPYNPTVLGPALIGIASGIINVAMHTLKTKNKGIKDQDEIIQKLYLIQDQLRVLYGNNSQNCNAMDKNKTPLPCS